MTLILTAIALSCAVLFGGGTRSGFLGDVAVQVLSVPLLVLAVLTLLTEQGGADGVHGRRRRRASWFLLLAILGVGAVQLLPLPAGLIGSITQRLPIGPVTLEGGTNPWHSISVAPQAAWSGLASLIVPVAIFLGVSQLGEHDRVRLSKLLVVLGAVSLVIGLLQVAQGPGSQLRFFEYTNIEDAVGFFANRNHFAALMYVLLVLVGAWLISFRAGFRQRDLLTARNLLLLAAAFGLVVATMAALATARSRAGMALTMVALVGLVVLNRSSARKSAGNPGAGAGISRLITVILGFAVLFAVQFGLQRMMTRFGTDPLEDLRIPLTLTTLDAALRSFPFGTGIGSFVPVFAVVERPTELMMSYANRAHNDFAEWLLEMGVVAPIVMGAALAWFVVASVRVWRAKEHTNEHAILQRAATLVVLLLLGHSLVDYPLRTTALISVFAFASALLLPAKHDPAHLHRDDRRHARAPREAMHAGRGFDEPRGTSRPLRPRESWGGQDVSWPEAWRGTKSDE